MKEERDQDRRGTDSYRGGGNKRRRDGTHIPTLSFTSSSVADQAQMMMALLTEMTAEALSDAAGTSLPVAATKSRPSPSCDASC